MHLSIRLGGLPTVTPHHPLLALTADASAFTFQSSAPLGTQLIAGGQHFWQHARAFLDRHPWIPTAAFFGIGAAALALGASHEAGTTLMAMGAMGSHSDRFQTLPSLPADSPLRNAFSHRLLLEETPYGRLFEGMAAAWETGPAAYNQLVEALPWYHSTRRQLEQAGIDLSVWEQGIAPHSQLISEEMRSAAPLESHRRIWELWFEEMLPNMRNPQVFFRHLCRALTSDFPWIKHVQWIAGTGADNFKRLLEAGLTGPSTDRPAHGLMMHRPPPNPMAFLARLGAAIQAQRQFGVQLNYFQVGLPGRHIVVETVPRTPRPGDPIFSFFVFMRTDDPQAKIYRTFLPYALTDPAAHVIGIRSGSIWIGAALLFAATNEHGQPVLIVDQIRVGGEHTSVSEQAQREIEKGLYQYILALEHDAGFVCTAIDRSLGAREDFPPRPFVAATKIHAQREPFRSARFPHRDSARKLSIQGTHMATVQGTLQSIRYQGLPPKEFLFRSALKTFDEHSCRSVIESEFRRIEAEQRIAYLRHQFPEAWALCEDKPMRPEFLENFGNALRYAYVDPEKRLAFCLRRLDEPWPLAKGRIREFTLFVDQQRRLNRSNGHY